MENLLKIGKQLCFLVYAFSREFTNLYTILLDKLDIAYPQYLVLSGSWSEKLKTVNQLGEKLRLDSGTLTPIVKSLEQKELIYRTEAYRMSEWY
ncbi:MarR family winged helix-turn-helix transcriptional regulator [Flavobacterium tegetincola]|uniref:MarR family winged helix-turn-helix transcriptional regulator n=1 Tax=Flavobacterium tegetincola TaxID=150172 RepID=UPI001FE101B8|nr:MarR family transcriptional regulator [Flavobacterium tegetincola]